MEIKQQKGFTLVEIAIVLVIIGLLLGGILKGQELINSARVRNLADQNSGVQAAYYGFIDRYRRIPGDFPAARASAALGVQVFLPDTTPSPGGVGNGRIDNNLEEAAAVWEQLAKSNFLGGGFSPATAVPASEATYRDVAPVNAFNGPLILTRNDGYTGAGTVRLNLHMGRNVPVNIARELDVKIDDGMPNTGVLRLTAAAPVFTVNFAPQFANCTTTMDATSSGNTAGTEADNDIYDIFDDAQDCGQVFLY